MVIFIAGTDTGVGKTFVTACLARIWKAKGIDVGVQKWVSTGNSTLSEDCQFIYEKAGIEGIAIPGSMESPYCFEFPASPHLAAELEGKRVDMERLRAVFLSMRKRHELLIVEGVGGVLVPISREVLLADLVSELDIPTLIVARSGLGTLNHTLLTIEALLRRDIDVLGVILNTTQQDDPDIINDNKRTIEEVSGIRVFGIIPHRKEVHEACPVVEPFASELLSHIKFSRS